MVLVSTTVFKQKKYIRNFQEYEKYLVITKIIELDSLFPFRGINGIMPKLQKRKLFRIEFVPGRFATITIPIIPVNTKFIESELLPIRGLLFRCTCDSNSVRIDSNSNEERKFLTYKVVVLANNIEKSEILFSGFKFFITNTELVKEFNTLEPCLKVGKPQFYLETNYLSDEPYPHLNLNVVEEELRRIKNINGQDTISDADFYFNTLKDRELFVKIPVLDLSIDTKKSNVSVILISLCFAVFGLNMFRQARINFKKNKGTEPFFLYDVSRDANLTIKHFLRINIFSMRLDSFIILFYHFISFLSPLFIIYLTSMKNYEGEITSNNEGPIIFLLFVGIYLVGAFFYNYLLLFTNKTGFFNVLSELVSEKKWVYDKSFLNSKTSFKGPKWFKYGLSLMIKDLFKEEDEILPETNSNHENGA